MYFESVIWGSACRSEEIDCLDLCPEVVYFVLCRHLDGPMDANRVGWDPLFVNRPKLWIISVLGRLAWQVPACVS